MKRMAAKLAFQHLREAWRQTLALVLMLAVSVMLALISSGYERGFDQEFHTADAGYLVVQQPNHIGEIGGSRLPPEIGELLATLGVEEVIPQINKAVGVSIEEVIQVRGVYPEKYKQTIAFEMLAGAELDNTTPARQVMIGWRLAQRLGASVGEAIALRGRNFQVIGIFQTRTFADNEAWISLTDAQTLLGWGNDVTIYFISDDGPLQPGAFLEQAAEVVQRGEAVSVLTSEIKPLMDYIFQVSIISTLACGFTLAVILLRLAWLHRRELAILNCLGFPPQVFGIYLLVQAALIVVSGSLLGLGGCWVASQWVGLQAAGYAVPLLLDPVKLAYSAAWLVMITLAGALLPAAWLYRVTPDQVLHVD